MDHEPDSNKCMYVCMYRPIAINRNTNRIVCIALLTSRLIVHCV